VRRWNFALQKGFAEARGQAAWRIGGQNPKQSAPGRHPGERLLQHADKQVPLTELPCREGRERPVGFKIGAEQNATGLDSRDPHDFLEECRRHVQHGDRLAHERQRRRQASEGLSVSWHCQVTRPSPRSDPKLGQVHNQPLLQLARAARSHQGRPRRTTADVDEEAGTIGLRAGAGKRCGRGPRSACLADSGNEDNPPVHRPAVLA
jgi:hypothetical protein